MYQKDEPALFYKFEDEDKEVRFLRYDMPTPWMNYLTNGRFTAMISHAGGGVAFWKSPQIFRINHYRFFHLPTDRSGFYTYIRDGNSLWCPTNQPVREKPDSWNSVHGLGYTRFEAEKNGLSVNALYFVGKDQDAMIWTLHMKSDRDRKITVCITKISTFLILCDLAVCLATLYVSFSLVFALMRYLQGKVFLIRFYSPTTLSSSRAEFRLPSRLACA